MLVDGSLGEPYLGSVSVRINRSNDYYAKAPWRGSWEQDGGMLLNQGIHMVDLLVWLLGDVKRVYGEVASTSNIPGKETEDIATEFFILQTKPKV